MDNTLYDWVSFFVPAVRAMLVEAARLLAVPEDDLRADLRAVHIARENTEHPFALLETRAVENRLPGSDRTQRYAHLKPAFEAFNRTRADLLCLYPGVAETLRAVQATGCRIVGHTEATAVNIVSRVRALGLQSTLDAVYAPQFTGLPHPLAGSPRSPADRVEVYELPSNARKPDPTAAKLIAHRVGVPATRCVYVGDSLHKDVAMAKRAGMVAAWARYGTRHDPVLWRELLALSHWDDSVVAKAERGFAAAPTDVTPDIVLDSFADLLAHVEFRKPRAIPDL